MADQVEPWISVTLTLNSFSRCASDVVVIFSTIEKFAVCLYSGVHLVFIVCKTRQRFVNIVKTRKANTHENLPNVECRRE